MKFLIKLITALSFATGGMVFYAIADYTISGAPGTMLGFICLVTKECPAYVLVNSSGTEIGTSGEPLRTDPTGSTVQPVSGPLTDSQLRATPVAISGTFWQSTQAVSLATNTPDVTDRSARLLGHVTVDNASLAVTGTFFQATQPISAASLPLPSGASTEATLALIKAKTDNIDVALSTRAVTGLTDTQLRASAVPVSGTFFQSTQPVSLASIPNSSNFDVALSTRLKPSDTLTKVTTVDTITNSVAVTGTFWQATQPVSGTFWQATQPVSIVSMPSTPVTGTFWQATQPVSGTFWQATQPISASALPLPTDASTETTLALIKAKTDNIDVALSTRTSPSDSQHITIDNGSLTQSIPIVVKVLSQRSCINPISKKQLALC